MSTARPYFSIVIPLYNKQEYIANTLDSVLLQTFPDFELLVINDGSTDESATLVKMFGDYRLRLFHQKNAGVSAARNHGINRARGKYIAFLDADDLWHPDYLAKMHKLITKYPDCGFYGAAHTVLEKHRSFTEGLMIPEGIVENYFQKEWTHHITRLSATVVNPMVFKKISGFPAGMISGEDSFFCATIACHFPVAYTPQPLVTYNKKFSGFSQRFDKVDNCKECWLELYAEGDFYRNELIAGKAIKAGLRYVLSFNNVKSRKLENDFGYTQLSKSKWRILFLLNRLPAPGIKMAIWLIQLKRLLKSFYQDLATRKAPEVKPETRPLRQTYPEPSFNLRTS